MPGPPPKLNRSRARDSKVTETMTWDGEIRGFELPSDALAEGEQWHPMVVSWWEAFRRSPQARLISSEMQWHTLVGAMRVYQDLWVGSERGRAVRAAEVRQVLIQFLVTPADARRNGIEFVRPEDMEPEPLAPEGVADLAAERRKRLMEQ